MIHILDLDFLGIDHAIASFLVETSEGPVLIESGPHSTFENLRKQVEKAGFKIEDVKHLLLTHIHFDHAGAAWALAELGAKVYVHPFGEGHMQDPTKLYNSAKMIYGDEMERLWGQMKQIDPDKLHAVRHGEKIEIGDKVFTGWHTPGHAKHHIAWQLDDVIFTGDVAGVKIENGPVVPPCPPPDINIEDWNESIDLILGLEPNKLYLTHYDGVTEIEAHMSDLKVMLNDWAYWIKDQWEQGRSAEEITPDFSKYTTNQLKERGLDDHAVKQYEAANPSWMSVAGLIRYWKKKSQS
jgi:glyoxylase-like metal-dependent hydrolase (beta-lactamase superfamily II)